MPSVVPVVETSTKKASVTADDAQSASIQLQLTDQPTDGLGQLKQIIQNKIRNLEKRKTKLEGYRDQLTSGKPLTEDQKTALSQFDSVEQSIDTQKDFLKVIANVQSDYGKQLKMQRKKEEREKQQISINRFRDLLRYQDVLNTLGNDEVRQDFLDGTKSAVKCSKEDMARYDDMYKKMCPTSEESTDWTKALEESALFAYNLVVGSSKPATGFDNVTFLQLKETLDNITACSYFHGKSTHSTSSAVKEAEAPVEPVEEQQQLQQQQHRPVEPTNSFDSSERSATPSIYAGPGSNSLVGGASAIPNGSQGAPPSSQPQAQALPPQPPPDPAVDAPTSAPPPPPQTIHTQQQPEPPAPQLQHQQLQQQLQPQQQQQQAPPQPQSQIFMAANDILASTHLNTITFLQEDQTNSRCSGEYYRSGGGGGGYRGGNSGGGGGYEGRGGGRGQGIHGGRGGGPGGRGGGGGFYQGGRSRGGGRGGNYRGGGGGYGGTRGGGFAGGNNERFGGAMGPAAAGGGNFKDAAAGGAATKA